MANAVSKVRQLIDDRKESVAQSVVFRKLYAWYARARHAYLLNVRRDFFGAFNVTLQYERHARSIVGWIPSPSIAGINAGLISSLQAGTGINPLLEAYAKTHEAEQFRQQFASFGADHEIRLRYPRDDESPLRQGDLLILKPCLGHREKGVILVQYNDSFRKLIAIYDVGRLAARYRLVLEPSTWGYRDAAILSFADCGTDVIVEAQHESDFAFIDATGTGLIPIRIGAGDWIDHHRFQPLPVEKKVFDVVMVASWQRIKRHDLLFRAVGRCGDAVRSVALIGYPAGGRTKDEVADEAERYGVRDRIHLFERIPREEVGRVISQSRIGVMLTIREGANKGIYECFFSGVPVVISARNIGINRDHINDMTGVVADDDELAQALVDILKIPGRFRPREWALQETGYENSTRRLNERLRQCALAHGESWTRDIFPKKNDTNAVYVRESDRIEADAATADLVPLLRRTVPG